MGFVFSIIGVAALFFAFRYFKSLLHLCCKAQVKQPDNVVYFDFGKHSLLNECLKILEQSRVVDVKISRGEQAILESIELSRNRDKLLDRINKKSA